MCVCVSVSVKYCVVSFRACVWVYVSEHVCECKNERFDTVVQMEKSKTDRVKACRECQPDQTHLLTHSHWVEIDDEKKEKKEEREGECV